MTERTRTFTGTMPENPAREAWQQAHDEMCRNLNPEGCWHENPHPVTVPVLVHVFEEVPLQAVGVIKGMEVALKSGEGRFARWSLPAKMAEEVLMADTAENDAHRVVASRPSYGESKAYTCACGEVILAHPDVLDEAFAFHLSRVLPPEGGKP